MLSKGDFTTFDDKSFAFLFRELKFKPAKDVKDKTTVKLSQLVN